MQLYKLKHSDLQGYVFTSLWFKLFALPHIKVVLWSNFYPLIFLGVSYRIPWKDKNAVYRLQISALVLEIFKFEKWVKYANEMTDDVIHSTQYYINYINRAILADF